MITFEFQIQHEQIYEQKKWYSEIKPEKEYEILLICKRKREKKSLNHFKEEIKKNIKICLTFVIEM